MSFAAVLGRLEGLENPYPGLRAFETSEAHLFFGRDQQIKELIARLERNRLVAVVGVSGSGKSSLVRAGLIPALHRGRVAEAASRWRIVVTRPAGAPFANLTVKLSEAGLDPAQLRRSSYGLIHVAQQLPAGESLLVVVDQFEEIFRYKDLCYKEPETLADNSRRRRDRAASETYDFVQVLLAASRHQPPVYVVITMRSDYLGDCAEFRDLPESLNECQYLIPRLTREQRKQAIEYPLGATKISPALVQRMLNDVGDEPDQLPILQHALMRTWSQWRESDPSRIRGIELADYEHAGGFQGALDQHADQLLCKVRADIAAIIFKRLTARGSNHRERRDPARLSEIWELSGAITPVERENVTEVVEQFRRREATYLQPREGSLGPDTYIDIAHESLIRQWKRLRDEWLPEEAKSAKRFLDLVGRARNWKLGGGEVLTGLDLADALEWDRRRNPTATWAKYYADETALSDVSDFIHVSLSEEKRREWRRKRTFWIVTGVSMAMFLLALVAAGFARFAFDQRRKASEAAHLAGIALAATNDAQAAKAHSDATAYVLQAREAELDGKTEEAAKLRALTVDATKLAQNYSKAAEAERNKAAALLEGKDKNYQDAVEQQIANLRTEGDELQRLMTSLSAEVEQLRNPVRQAQRPQAKPAPTVDTRTAGGTGGGTPGVTAVTTYHYDNRRSGWNSQESQLDYSSVNDSSLGVQVVRLDDVNDQVDAQPLVALKVQIAGGKHDVVYVATEANNIYAFDAYTGARLKMVNLGPPVHVSCQLNGPVVGITGTPAIDVPSSKIYVVTYNIDSSKRPVYFIHALDLGTLTDKVPPQQVTASQTLNDGTTFKFNAAWQRQLSGLLVANGNVYVGFGGFCGAGGAQARGWILGFQGGSLTPLPTNLLTNSLSSAPNGIFGSGVWMSGYGIAGDQNGIYFSTGSSDPGGTTYNENTNISNSVVRLNPDLTRPSSVTKFLFTPANVTVLERNDLDMGAGGVMLLPSRPGPVSNMAVATAKDGRMFLLNRDNLGGYTPTDTGALKVVEIGNGCWCGPTHFNDGTLHIVSSGGISPRNTVGPNSGISHNSVGLWNLQTSPAPTLSQSASGNMPDTIQDPGFFTTVSSNANKNAIIWAVSRPQPNSKNPLLWLYAFKATPAGNTLPQLFQSPAGSWPYLAGDANVVPVVANGRVYVASYRELDIFGLIRKAQQTVSGCQPHGVTDCPPGRTSDGTNAGTRVTTKATARTEAARAEVAKGPEGHQVSGVVLKIDGDRLTIQTRNNKTAEVDVVQAKRSSRYSDIGVGTSVVAAGLYDANGVLQALFVYRVIPSPDTWPPDY